MTYKGRSKLNIKELVLTGCLLSYNHRSMLILEIGNQGWKKIMTNPKNAHMLGGNLNDQTDVAWFCDKFPTKRHLTSSPISLILRRLWFLLLHVLIGNSTSNPCLPPIYLSNRWGSTSTTSRPNIHMYTYDWSITVGLAWWGWYAMETRPFLEKSSSNL